MWPLLPNLPLSTRDDTQITVKETCSYHRCVFITSVEAHHMVNCWATLCFKTVWKALFKTTRPTNTPCSLVGRAVLKNVRGEQNPSKEKETDFEGCVGWCYAYSVQPNITRILWNASTSTFCVFAHTYERPDAHRGGRPSRMSLFRNSIDCGSEMARKPIKMGILYRWELYVTGLNLCSQHCIGEWFNLFSQLFRCH